MSLDNEKGLFPDFSEDELAALPRPPAPTYPAQADGDLVRLPPEMWFNAPPQGSAPRADLETVLAFVLRLREASGRIEYPPHVEAALRLRAWLETGAQNR